MRVLLALVLVVAGFSTPAWAYDDPMDLVRAIYQPYQSPGGSSKTDVSQFYSKRLQGLLAAHAAKATDDLISSGSEAQDTGPVAPALAFNPFVEGDHPLIMDLAIGEPVLMSGKALVTVSYHNFDAPTMLSLSLVHDPDGWKVDDVASMGGEQNWMLSWLLQYDPFSQN